MNFIVTAENKKEFHPTVSTIPIFHFLAVSPNRLDLLFMNIAQYDKSDFTDTSIRTQFTAE